MDWPVLSLYVVSAVFMSSADKIDDRFKLFYLQLKILISNVF